MVLTYANVAVATTIDFESLPDPQPREPYNIDIQYAPVGAIFDYPDLDVTGSPRRVLQAESPDYPAPHAGSFFLRGPDEGREQHDSDLEITFSSAQSTVTLYGGTGSSCPAATGILKAFKADGTPINGLQDSHVLTPGSTSVQFSISFSTPVIWKVSFQAIQQGTGCLEAIDDLTFEGNPPPPPGPPPTIEMSSPMPGNQNYTAVDLHATGTIDSSALFPSMLIDLTEFDTQTGTPTTTTTRVSLLIGIPVTAFDFIRSQAGLLALGRYEMVATVSDYYGQQAQAVVDFSNVSGQPSDPGLGTFRFAVPDDKCQIAYYDNGAEAFFDDPSLPPMPVPTSIAAKWMTVRSPILGARQTLGCPQTGAVPVTTTPLFSNGIWTIQDFDRGRIYVSESGSAAYVPKVVVSAINTVSHFDVNGVVDEFNLVGWPAGDPTYFLDADDPVWIFQRFSQNDLGPLYWNTIEVRGRLPRIYIERIGGDMNETRSAFQQADNTVPPAYADEHTPTQWLDFPCSKGSTDPWPTSCDLSSAQHPDGDGYYVPKEQAIVAAPACGMNSADCVCHGTQNGCKTFSGPTSDLPIWTDQNPVAPNLQPINYTGIIRALDEIGPSPGSHLANDDYPFSHANCNTTSSNVFEDIGASLATITACAVSYPSDVCSDAENWLVDSFGRSCRSDWNLHTRPLPTYKDWRFLAIGNIKDNVDFEIEFEWAWARPHYYQQFLPSTGDMVTVHGRQIVDCGHCDPFKTEVHPPDTMIVARSFLVPAFSDPIASPVPARVTDAYIWANGFFPGTLSVGIEVYAPPRPSPTAALSVFHHENGYFLTHKIQESTPLQLRPSGALMTLSNGNNFYVYPDMGSVGDWRYPDDPAEFVDNWLISWSD